MFYIYKGSLKYESSTAIKSVKSVKCMRGVPLYRRVPLLAAAAGKCKSYSFISTTNTSLSTTEVI